MADAGTCGADYVTLSDCTSQSVQFRIADDRLGVPPRSTFSYLAIQYGCRKLVDRRVANRILQAVQRTSRLNKRLNHTSGLALGMTLLHEPAQAELCTGVELWLRLILVDSSVWVEYFLRLPSTWASALSPCDELYKPGGDRSAFSCSIARTQSKP